MKQVTLTSEQITNILQAFSEGKYDHISCPRGCCWETKPVEDYIPQFITNNQQLFTIEVEEPQIKEIES